MKTEYWNLCYKPENCAEHCPRCEKHWYSMHGYIFSSQYICQLGALEKCPFDQPEFEKTEAPAQLKSDLKYELDDVVSIEMKVASEGENKNKTIISFKNGSELTVLPARGQRAKCNFIEDGNTSAICYWCDFFNSEKKKCKKHHPIPEVNQTCPYIQSTGANQ